MTEELIGTFEANRVERMLRQVLGGKLARDETLRVVSGTKTQEWIEVVFEWANASRTTVYRVDARVSVKANRLRDRQAVELLYDLLGAQFDEMLGGDRQPFTGPKWEQVEFGTYSVFVRGQVRNEAAEASASALIDAVGVPSHVKVAVDGVPVDAEP